MLSSTVPAQTHGASLPADATREMSPVNPRNVPTALSIRTARFSEALQAMDDAKGSPALWKRGAFRAAGTAPQPPRSLAARFSTRFFFGKGRFSVQSFPKEK